MANKQISQLNPKPTPVAATDQFGIDDNLAVAYKITVANLETYFNSKYVPLTGGTMTGLLILSGDPVVDLGAATKQYVDNSIISVGNNATTRVATTANLTAVYANGSAGIGATLTNSGVQVALSIDSVAMVVGDRVLVKNQSSSLQNGIYVVTDIGSGATNWVLTRATDNNTPAKIKPGEEITVAFGTSNGYTQWLQSAVVTTIGTDPITYVENAAASIGLSRTNNTLRIAATPTSGVVLRGDGSNWVASTPTYANTYAINTILYASALDTVTGLATGNDGVLITSAGGVPSISSTLPTAVQSNITRLGAQAIALNMNTNLINNVVDPVSEQDAATKKYVDDVAQGRTYKNPVAAASTGALTATYANGASGVGATLTNAGAMAAFQVDGYSAAVNDRILIKDQASSFQNGIYVVTTVGSGAVNWVLTRATDMDTPSQFVDGTTFILNGTTQAGQTWTETATVVTIGTDPVTFVQTGDATGVSSVATAGLATGGPITTTGTVTVTAAVQADMETGSSNTVAVTPGVFQYHASTNKAWANISNGGVPAVVVSYNVTSVTDGGTGIATVNFTTGFSSGSYGGVWSLNDAAGAAGMNGFSIEVSNTGFRVFTFNSAAAALDVGFNCAFQGDL